MIRNISDMVAAPPAQYVYSRRSIAGLLDQGPQKAAVYVETDGPSGVALFTVYDDDGRGNGNCLLSLPLSELVKLAAKVQALG